MPDIQNDPIWQIGTLMIPASSDWHFVGIRCKEEERRQGVAGTTPRGVTDWALLWICRAFVSCRTLTSMQECSTVAQWILDLSHPEGLLLCACWGFYQLIRIFPPASYERKSCHFYRASHNGGLWASLRNGIKYDIHIMLLKCSRATPMQQPMEMDGRPAHSTINHGPIVEMLFRFFVRHHSSSVSSN